MVATCMLHSYMHVYFQMIVQLDSATFMKPCQVSLFNCFINMSCSAMSFNVTNHAMHLIGLL